MKDRCKLFCRVAGSTAYYQLRDRVIDGTPCGPDTNDICVQGLCRVSVLTHGGGAVQRRTVEREKKKSFRRVQRGGSIHVTERVVIL